MTEPEKAFFVMKDDDEGRNNKFMRKLTIYAVILKDVEIKSFPRDFILDAMYFYVGFTEHSLLDKLPCTAITVGDYIKFK